MSCEFYSLIRSNTLFAVTLTDAEKAHVIKFGM